MCDNALTDLLIVIAKCLGKIWHTPYWLNNSSRFFILKAKITIEKLIIFENMSLISEIITDKINTFQNNFLKFFLFYPLFYKAIVAKRVMSEKYSSIEIVFKVIK